MCNKLFFKFFTFVFVFILFCGKAFSVDENILSRIIVDNDDNGNYTLNLFFDREYKGKAYLQKVKNNSYTIFLPETLMNENEIEILYSTKQDANNVSFNIEEKEMIKENQNSFYTKISVNTVDNASVSLVSKVIEKEIKSTSHIPFLISVILFIIALSMIVYFIRLFRTSTNNSHTFYPTKRINPEQVDNNDKQLIEKSEATSESVIKETKELLPVIKKVEIEKPTKTVKNTTNPTIQKSTLPKVNIKKSLRPADKSSFDCFDIPVTSNDENNNIEFKSTLKQTSNLLNKKSNVKLKHTNPMTENTSGLLIPAVEDIMPKKKVIETTDTTPELISVLNITNDKGFYLTTVNEKLALFGFIRDNVFLLSTFQDLTQINLQARFYDKSGNNDIYIVKLDSYKAMVEISNDSMKELAKL